MKPFSYFIQTDQRNIPMTTCLPRIVGLYAMLQCEGVNINIQYKSVNFSKKKISLIFKFEEIHQNKIALMPSFYLRDQDIFNNFTWISLLSLSTKLAITITEYFHLYTDFLTYRLLYSRQHYVMLHRLLNQKSRYLHTEMILPDILKTVFELSSSSIHC